MLELQWGNQPVPQTALAVSEPPSQAKIQTVRPLLGAKASFPPDQATLMYGKVA